MAKVIIIGWGMVGLSAGIYALLNGFNVVTYEKNNNAVGTCTG